MRLAFIIAALTTATSHSKNNCDRFCLEGLADRCFDFDQGMDQSPTFETPHPVNEAILEQAPYTMGAGRSSWEDQMSSRAR